eukprot:CAMPEP_0173425250 /NCGR_PEP_ID=MMETSP1357-20121228/5015_1 /TAXON_ID=77926 /ORGANISM="Hemiselmis rufescens, Strain PCC563" /LENGTH=75 /DNA_ID=CAMNT_0014388659 /DNA_START=441 /DNA_END=664 /DNA_ORIENTATION=+
MRHAASCLSNHGYPPPSAGVTAVVTPLSDASAHRLELAAQPPALSLSATCSSPHPPKKSRRCKWVAGGGMGRGAS